tara:strand:- start:114 stop:275 length:162 start_codon:yes stop_codon:yes gene_type:complete
MLEIKKLFSDIEMAFNILKVYVLEIKKENKYLKNEIKKLQDSIDEIIKSSKKQ